MKPRFVFPIRAPPSGTAWPQRVNRTAAPPTSAGWVVAMAKCTIEVLVGRRSRSRSQRQKTPKSAPSVEPPQPSARFQLQSRDPQTAPPDFRFFRSSTAAAARKLVRSPGQRTHRRRSASKTARVGSERLHLRPSRGEASGGGRRISAVGRVAGGGVRADTAGPPATFNADRQSERITRGLGRDSLDNLPSLLSGGPRLQNHLSACRSPARGRDGNLHLPRRQFRPRQREWQRHLPPQRRQERSGIHQP